MKKTLLLITVLSLLFTAACDKKKKEEPSPKKSEYFFKGTLGSSSFEHMDGRGGYENIRSVQLTGNNVVGDDTTYRYNYAASVQYVSMGGGPSKAVPYFALERSGYESVGINNTLNLANAFAIGTHNFSDDFDYTLYYNPDYDDLSFTGAYHTSELGTITINSVEYMGSEEWFGDRVRVYKVSGSVDCYVYKFNWQTSAYDSLKVVGDFALGYQSASY